MAHYVVIIIMGQGGLLLLKALGMRLHKLLCVQCIYIVQQLFFVHIWFYYLCMYLPIRLLYVVFAYCTHTRDLVRVLAGGHLGGIIIGFFLIIYSLSSSNLKLLSRKSFQYLAPTPQKFVMCDQINCHIYCHINMTMAFIIREKIKQHEMKNGKSNFGFSYI